MMKININANNQIQLNHYAFKKAEEENLVGNDLWERMNEIFQDEYKKNPKSYQDHFVELDIVS